ncbi:NAD(P)/FAD-dependent oxidoreductase [Deinococcus peraridilitoris]|uniref:Ferredoxin--NADP reductase n=1 Tax=Deinococcus peraridilitoris (strain DSM 19664 / LMG 22246 / CIP 109416 / KR-200) TaxID=937777 RepID=K9ZXH1_DEIPD|nr:NAD(P)/FAD-dependent oxidoreductase [Deinococcus peraridilitoris]AFZ65899.1 thioredoxin reductase [Deinococcus peraridilitoris DSM 19664]
MTHADVLIVGAGPVGLYAAFYVALRGLSVRLVESRPEVGGQLSALYPEKFIYDAPGFPRVRAHELVESLRRQLHPFSPALELGALAMSLELVTRGWQVTTWERTGERAYTAGAVILAAGIGALRPRVPDVAGVDLLGRVALEWPGAVVSPGDRVLVSGGVPQATRAALDLHDQGARVTLAHKRALFRGTPEQLTRLQQLREAGRLQVLAPSELLAFTPEGAELLFADARHALTLDGALYLNGYLPDLQSLQGWPLEWQGDYISSGAGQSTNLPGVFVAGDLSSSGGDLKLLAAGFAEAAVAANHAVHFVRPDLKVRPGHSSDKKLPTT